MDDTETLTETVATETAITREPWEEANDLAADVIAEIAGEFDGGDDESTPAAAVEEGAADTTLEAAPSPDKETKPDPAEERGLQRLVEREVEIRRKEDSLATREAAVSKLESRIQELETKASSYQSDFHEHLRMKPTEALQAAGHDPDQVVRVYLAEKLTREGKPVPAELKTAIEKAEQTYEIAKLRREQQDFQRHQAAAHFVAGIEAGARTYITQGVSKDAPTVAEVAARQPERVYREIMDEIARDAQGKAGKEPNAPVLTYDEAAKRVEARWTEFRSLFSVSAPPAASTGESSPTATKTPSKTVAPQGASTPPAKPIKPLSSKKPATQAELEKSAIDAGIAEFKRSEAARKASA